MESHKELLIDLHEKNISLQEYDNRNIKITMKETNIYGCTSDYLKKVQEAAKNGGEATRNLMKQQHEVLEYILFLYEKYKNNELDSHIIIGWDDKDKTRPLLFSQQGKMEIRSRNVELNQNNDKKYTGTSSFEISYNGANLVEIRADVEYVGESLAGAILTQALIQVLKTSYVFAIQFMNAIRLGHSVSLAVETGLVNSRFLAGGFTKELALRFAGGILIFASVYLAGELLFNTMHHVLQVYNGTDNCLKYTISNIDAGQFLSKPYTGDENNKKFEIPGATTEHYVTTYKYGTFKSQTSNMAEGVGYIIKFDFEKDILGKNKSLFLKVQIPYSGKNSVRLEVLDSNSDGEKLYDKWDDKYEVYSTSTEWNGYKFILSMDYLDGEHPKIDKPDETGYYYTSVLHIEKHNS